MRLIDTSRSRPAAKPFASLFAPNNHRISSIAISPDGRWVVTAGPGKAGVWSVSADDLESNRLYFLAGHGGALNGATFAPQGWMLATAAADGSIRTFTCTLCGGTPELARLARARLTQLRGA